MMNNMRNFDGIAASDWGNVKRTFSSIAFYLCYKKPLCENVVYFFYLAGVL